MANETLKFNYKAQK